MIFRNRKIKLLMLPLLLAVAGGINLSCQAASAKSASSEDQVLQKWMLGFAKLEEANKAQNQHQPAIALDLYRQAHNVFKEVQALHPGWNQELINYRLNYCKSRIQYLEAVTAGAEETLSKADLLLLIRTLRRQIEPLQEKTDQTDKALRNAQAQVEALTARVKELEQRKND